MSVPPSAPGSGRLPRRPMVAIAVLTLCAAVLGLQSWPQPARTSFGWQVAQVPGSLWTLLAATTIVCFSAALAVSSRAGLRLSDPITWAWGILTLLAGAALVWDGLYLATFSPGPVAIIPVFDWLFTFAPALLAGLLFMRRNRSARRAAALCTGVVTVPMLALAWALLDGPGLSLGGVGATLWDTAFFGVLPLTVAIALAGSIGKQEMPGLSH